MRLKWCVVINCLSLYVAAVASATIFLAMPVKGQGFSNPTRVKDEAYGASWNGDTRSAASRNAIYDEIESIVAGALDVILQDIVTQNPTTNEMLYWTAPATSATIVTTALGRSLLDEPNALTLAGTIDSNDHIDIRWFGALGDPVNDTDAVQAAIDYAEAHGSKRITIPAGTWNFQVTLDTSGTSAGAAYPIIQGEGTNGTIIRAIDANEACIHITGESHWRYPYTIRDLRIDGKTRDCNGISVDAVNGVFGLRLENVSFTNCDIGLHNQGLIWYQADFCTFVGCNYGMRLEPGAGSHSGCATFDNCNWSSCNLAAIYADVYQCTLYKGVVEDNPGYGLFLADSKDAYPFVIDGTWFESNGSAASVTIDGTAYTPGGRDVYALGGGRLVYDRLYSPSTVLGNSTQLIMYDCELMDSEYLTTADTNSIVAAYNSTIGTTNSSYGRVSKWYTPGAISSTDQTATIEPNAVKQAWRTHPTSDLAWDRTNLWPEGSLSIQYTPDNAGIATVTWVTDANAPIWPTVVKVANMTVSGTDYTTGVQDLTSTEVTITENKWYVFSVDVKTTLANGYLALYDKVDSSSAVLLDLRGHTGDPATYGYPMWATTDQWRRYVTVRQAPVSGSLTEIRLYNPYTTDPNYLLANMQLVECDTPQEAYEYVQRNAIAPGSWVSRKSPLEHVTVTVVDDGDWANEALPIWSVPTGTEVTVVSVRAASMGTTPSLTYNLEERAWASLASAGTDLYAADQAADADGEIETAFSNAALAAGAHIVFTTGATPETGTVTLITITIVYRKE